MEPTADQRRASRPIAARSHLFAVRLWREEAAVGPEYRGSVRDVASGAYRNFRDWSDLAAFMVVRIEEAENASAPQTDGERHGRVSGDV
jgi:hypothetical protein